MSNKKLIQQYVTIGRKIPKYQFNKLSDNLLKSYLYYRSRQNYIAGYEFEKLIDLDKNAAIKLSNGYHSAEVDETLKTADNPEKIIDYFLDGDRIPLRGKYTLFMYSNRPKSVAERVSDDLPTIKSLLDNTKTRNLLDRTPNPLELYEVFPEEIDKYLDSTLDGYHVAHDTLYVAYNPDGIIDILLTKSKFIEMLDDYIFSGLLTYAKDHKSLINKLGRRGKELLDEVASSRRLIKQIISNANNPRGIIEVLGDKGKETINSMSFEDILYSIYKTKSTKEDNDKLKSYLSLFSYDAFIGKIKTDLNAFKETIQELDEPLIIFQLLDKEDVDNMMSKMSYEEKYSLYKNAENTENLSKLLFIYHVEPYSNY